MGDPTTGAPDTIMVVGFGRSGTSLTTRVLNVLGMHLGEPEELLPAQDGDNPRGYWEPTWMNAFNDEVLAALGTSWYRPLDAAPGWEDAPELRPLRDRAAALLEQKLGGAPLRGFKDPRTTLTLPLWKRVVPDARFVLCVRNPLDAIASLQRRPEPTLSVRAWGERWLEYMGRALRETAGSPRHIVFYEDYFAEPAEQIDCMAAFLGVPRDERIGEARALVERGLQHHATSAEELAASWIPAPARALYLGLRAAELLRRCSPELGDELFAAMSRLGPDLWWEAQHGAEATERSEAAAARAAAAQAALAAAQAELREQVGELAVARHRANVAEQERARLASELDAARRATESTRRVVDDLLASWSWRATTPLRAAKRRLAGRR